MLVFSEIAWRWTEPEWWPGRQKSFVSEITANSILWWFRLFLRNLELPLTRLAPSQAHSVPLGWWGWRGRRFSWSFRCGDEEALEWAITCNFSSEAEAWGLLERALACMCSSSRDTHPMTSWFQSIWRGRRCFFLLLLLTLVFLEHVSNSLQWCPKETFNKIVFCEGFFWFQRGFGMVYIWISRIKAVVVVMRACSVVSDCDPRNCSPTGSSVNRIPQARMLVWSPCPPPRDCPDPRIKPRYLMFPALAGGFFTTWTIRETPINAIL